MNDKAIPKQNDGPHPDVYVIYPNSSNEAIRRGLILAEQVREALKNSNESLFEEGMTFLRDRSNINE